MSGDLGCSECGGVVCSLTCQSYIEWVQAREPRRKKSMETDNPSVIDTFGLCASAIEKLSPEQQQRVLAALREFFFGFKPAVANQPLPQGWQQGGLSQKQRSVLDGITPIGSTDYPIRYGGDR